MEIERNEKEYTAARQNYFFDIIYGLLNELAEQPEN